MTIVKYIERTTVTTMKYCKPARVFTEASESNDKFLCITEYDHKL